MLVIISDLHLEDGTCGGSISTSAFRLFTARLQELAYNASWRTDGSYRPLKEINLLWLGDILDPLHSTRWLDTKYGDENYVRPWTDTSAPEFAKKLHEITRAILKHNRYAVDAINNITNENAITLPPAIGNGQPDPTAKERILVKVNIYYMVGNHDWVYHLPGEDFNQIRQEIIDAFGLASHNSLFPHEIEEDPKLNNLLKTYNVYARHGDIYDNFNYNKKKGRDVASLGDMFTIEVVNRFPLELENQLGDKLPEVVLKNFYEWTNVRPVLAVPLWFSNQLTNNNLSVSMQNKIKSIWNEVTIDFLDLQKVYYPAKPFQFSIRNVLVAIMHILKNNSVSMNSALTLWAYKNLWKEEEHTLAERALQEKAFLEKEANYIVYGHAHKHELIPLDLPKLSNAEKSQLYFNSGTWHTYYSLARYQPKAKRFIPYQVISYLTFYKEDQREGRLFETWSGASL